MSLAIVQRDTPPPRSHRPPADLRATVEDLRRRHRRADPGKLSEMLVTVLSEDAALLLEASQFIIAKIGAALDAQQRRQQAAPNVRQRAERKVAETKAVAEAVAKVKMAVLDMVMPTLDKPLRFCRGAEIAALGAGFQRLAAAVPPDAMIGEVLTDKEAAKLLRPDA